MPDMNEYKKALNGITASEAFKERTAEKMRAIRDAEPEKKPKRDITVSVGRIAPVAAMAACAAIVFALYTNTPHNISYTAEPKKDNAPDMAIQAERIEEKEELDIMEETAAEATEEPCDAAGVETEITTTMAMAEEYEGVEEDECEDDGMTGGVLYAETVAANIVAETTLDASWAVSKDELEGVWVSTAAAEENIAETKAAEETIEEEFEYEDFEKDDVEDEEDEYIAEIPVNEVYSLDAGDAATPVMAAGAANTDGAAYAFKNSMKVPDHIIVRDARDNVTPSTVYNDFLGGSATVTSAVSGLPQMLSPEATDELIREITSSEKELRRDHISPSDTLYVIDLANSSGDGYMRVYVSTVTVTYRVSGGSGDMFVTYELDEFPQILSSLTAP